MFNQTKFGMPRICRRCKQPFTRTCHEGFQPKGMGEVFTVLTCAGCSYKHKVTQPLSMVHEYLERLPKSAEKAVTDPISQSDVDTVQKTLNGSVNPLKSLRLTMGSDLDK